MYDPITATIGAIGTIGNLASGYLGSRAATKAANTQADAARYAADLQNQQFQQQFEAMQPWRQAGAGALGQMTAGLAPGGEFRQPFKYDPMQDPSTQFRFGMGQQAVEASQAAKGGYFSGATGQALQGYGQNFASQEYMNAYNRFQQEQGNLYNRLAGLAGTGMTAQSEIGQMGMQSATNIGNLMVGAGQARAAGQLGSASAWTGAMQGIGNQAISGLGSYQNYLTSQRMMDILGGGGGMGGGATGISFSPLDTSLPMGGGYGAYNVLQ